jgi:hypothetical protein
LGKRAIVHGLIAERKVAGGGTVAVFADITALKQRELQLEEANQRTQEAASEISRKHRELETLSSKLAKYLSPQVYASIFEGRQRSSSPATARSSPCSSPTSPGSPRPPDQMESEDLTQLPNQYLTEMPRAARPPAGAGLGAFYGVLVWGASYLGWIPGARILKPATQHPGRRNGMMVACHLVWGATMAATLRELQRANAEIFAGHAVRDAVPDGGPALRKAGPIPEPE